MDETPTISKAKLHVKKLTDEEKAQLVKDRQDEQSEEPVMETSDETQGTDDQPGIPFAIRLPRCPTCKADMVPDDQPIRPSRQRVRFTTYPQDSGRQVPRHKKRSRKKPVVYTDDEYDQGLSWKCTGQVWTGRYAGEGEKRHRVTRPCTTRIHIRQ